MTLISQLCGAITPEVWPGVRKLDLFTKMELPKDDKRKVKERLQKFVKDQYALDLLDKLLTLDPGKRVGANEALDADFFWVDPLPYDLDNMLSRHNKSMFEYLAPPRRRLPIHQQQQQQTHAVGAVRPAGHNPDQHFEPIF